MLVLKGLGFQEPEVPLCNDNASQALYLEDSRFLHEFVFNQAAREQATKMLLDKDSFGVFDLK